MSHFEFEKRGHQQLAEHRRKEEENRIYLGMEFQRLRESGKLMGDFPNDFVVELRKTSLDWRIRFSEEGVSFTRDFPYETQFYGMPGWDAARVVVNLDVQRNAVVFRAHLYDQMADVRIDEGLLVENGQVASYEREMVGGGMYRSELARIHMETEATKGKNGSLFDHISVGIDRLPFMVRELSGEDYRSLLAAFLRRVEEGKIDVKTMPRLALGWPLTSPYHAAATGE